MRAEGNVKNITGNTTASGTGFTPSYMYQLEGGNGLEAAISSGAGPP